VLSVGVALGNLLYLYTGITRGKRLTRGKPLVVLVVLVGQKKAIAIACAMSREDGDGRSWQNGWALAQLISEAG
jgi:hypothetical protein